MSIADYSSGDPEVVLPSERGGTDRSGLSFSPDGRWLLVDNLSQYQRDGGGSNRPGGRAVAIPTAGGEPVPVADDRVINPTWAPAGHAIAYVEYPYTLKVVAEPGGEPRELLRANTVGAADRMRLNWAPDTILAYVDGDRVLLPVED